MDRLKQHILVIIFTINATLLFAQNSSTTINEKNLKTSTTETIYIQINNNALLSGETLFYQLHCLNPINFKPSEISKVAHVKLLSLDNKVVVEQKMRLQNGVGKGDIFIPSELKSGIYRLVGYTNWSLNKSSFKYFTQDITIVNPFQIETKDLIAKSVIEVKNHEHNSLNSTNGSIAFDKKNYSTRELVTTKVNFSDQLSIGNYSVSIKKVDAFVSKKADNAIAFSKINSVSENLISNNSALILPEFRGEIISGEIKTKNNKNSINSVSIGLSIPGENFIFKIVKTNLSGKFHFILDEDYVNQKVILQVVSPLRNEYEINLTNEYPVELTPGENQFHVNQEMITSIKERAIATQIENAYFDKKKDSTLSSTSGELFYKTLQKEYILDNYNRFPTLLETIIEVLKEVYYENNNNQYSFGVRDYDESIEVYEPTLVLVDGNMIQDGNEIINLKMETIHKVSIIQGGYYYGSNIFNGMISIESKNHDYDLKAKGNFIVNSNQIICNPSKKYYHPDYSKEANKRIPDYRHQLLWLPEYDITKPISFYTSDIKGTFEIIIEGFSNEGLPLYVKNTFNVN